MQNLQLPHVDGEHPLDTAARLVGGRGALAKKLAVSVAAIGNWKTRGVPIEHCVEIESSTGRLVPRQMLRPNDWNKIWPELAPALANTAQPAAETVAQGVANV